MAGEHAAPVGWLERWSQTEPLRLYLYGITVPLLGVCVVYGWMTHEQMGAWLALAGTLFLGSSVAAELARAHAVWSPASVVRAIDHEAGRAYEMGWADASRSDQQQPATVARARVRVCTEVEDGRRCTLLQHAEVTPHHYG